MKKRVGNVIEHIRNGTRAETELEADEHGELECRDGKCRQDAGFFFQAEDGIRDGTVTGVQTCALPISTSSPKASAAWASAWPPGVRTAASTARRSDG